MTSPKADGPAVRLTRVDQPHRPVESGGTRDSRFFPTVLRSEKLAPQVSHIESPTDSPAHLATS